MRGWVGLVCGALLIGCGGDSGIIIAVSQDGTVGEAPQQLQFVFGVLDPSDGTYVRDDFEADDLADVTGRDLSADPYELLLRDRGANRPSELLVAVFATRAAADVGFAATDTAIAFRDGRTLRYTLTLGGVADGDYWTTTTGCLGWDQLVIASPTDRDCDGCDDVTGAGCADECTDAGDCLAAAGDPPCGLWECNRGQCEVACDDCSDADRDGYGAGAGCAGLDCDDADDAVFEGVSRACYGGPPGSAETGTCRAGSQSCREGNWSICSGEVIPGGEACNGDDEDCDGVIDEDLGDLVCGLGACQQRAPACAGGAPGSCSPGAPAADDSSCDGIDSDCDGAIDEDCPCVLAGPGGDDALAVADSNVTAFETVQGAIDWASADPARPQVVCLAAAACGATHSFQGEVVMADGVQLLGQYDLTRSRCARGSGTVTEIANETSEGVLVPSEVQSPTSIDGVRIRRADEETTAGISVVGARNLVLSNIEIIDQPAATHSYGIDLASGAEVTITRSSIWGGDGSEETVGVRSIGARPRITGNCGDLDQGRCATWCGQGTARAIRGRYKGGAGATYAVLLADSPGAVIESSAICGTDGDIGAAIKIEGAADGTVVRTSLISAFGASVEADGILMESCGGAAPWVVDNWQIWAEGELVSTPVASVRAVGDCHPVIERNREITGGSEGGTVGTTGIYCGSDGSASSRCVVLDNPKIRGSVANFPPEAIGVRCENGGCMRIEGNTIDGFQAVDATGLWLGATGALVANNRITGGCATRSATAVRADGSAARLENNLLFGGACTNTGAANAPVYTGLRSIHRGGASELDVHSNQIEGQGHAAACDSRGVSFESATGAASPPRDILRNNIIGGGLCATARAVVEVDDGADPRVVENNDLTPLGTNTALYRDEGSVDLTRPLDIDALVDIVVSGTISADPMQTGYPLAPKLTAGSACVDAGTAVGAPATDRDGELRDASPDIGPDELMPGG